MKEKQYRRYLELAKEAARGKIDVVVGRRVAEIKRGLIRGRRQCGTLRWKGKPVWDAAFVSERAEGIEAIRKFEKFARVDPLSQMTISDL